LTSPVVFAPRSARLDLDAAWNDGTDPNEPALQVHSLDEHTVMIRQSLQSSPEGPFVFLLFGNERALLVDTGHARDLAQWPLRETVDTLIGSWLELHPRSSYALVVAHSHAHSDHTGGDEQFDGRPQTTVVGAKIEEVVQFFGLSDWPDRSAKVDLGGRELEVIPSPGHHKAAVSYFDPYSGVLFTGDTVYPGRLYVPDMEAFLTTMGRLVNLAETGEVSLVVGGHIELDRQGRDYPLGVNQHENEESPFMPPERLRSILEATEDVAWVPGVHRYDDFVIYSGNRIRDRLRMIGRALWSRFRG
jgi:hydroxyacylglutathione hydrolase